MYLVQNTRRKLIRSKGNADNNEGRWHIMSYATYNSGFTLY